MPLNEAQKKALMAMPLSYEASATSLPHGIRLATLESLERVGLARKWRDGGLTRWDRTEAGQALFPTGRKP